MPTRREYLAGLGLLGAASGAFALGRGTDAFQSAAIERPADVDVAGDPSAFLGLEVAHPPKMVWSDGTDTVNDLVVATNNLSETADVTFTDLTAAGESIALHDGSSEVGDSLTVTDVGAGGSTSVNAAIPEAESAPGTDLAVEVRSAFGDNTITVERAVTVEDGLLGYYPFEKDVSSDGASVPDRSHNANTATAKNGAKTNETGKLGDAAYVDGYGDYFDVSGLSGDFQNQSFTIALWYNPNLLGSSEPTRTLFGVYTSSNNGEYVDLAVEGDGTVHADYGGSSVTTSGTPVSQGTWHHVVARYDHSADTTDVFVDGSSVASGSAGPFTGSSPGVYVGILEPGTAPNTSDPSGRFDDVRVYGRALSDSEIQDLYDLDFTDNAGGGGGGGGGSDSTAPTAPSNLSSPNHGGTFVDLNWDASSDDGGSGLDHYNVYVDGTKDHEVAAGTTSTTVDGLSTNTSYDFHVTAVDGAGNESSKSNTVTVTTDSQSPYGRDSPWPIPGLVEAEDFDVGGQNVAYYDTTAENKGGASYRSTAVDIGADDQGDYTIGYIQDGEWLEYTVTVGSAGTYELDARVASNGGGGPFHVEMNGTDVTGSIAVPDTGSYDTYTTVTTSEIDLEAGDKTMRVAMDGDAFNLDHLDWHQLLYDTCEDLTKLHSSSDTGSLSVDTFDQSYFEKPDGTTDGYRIGRTSTSDAAMIYAPGGEIQDLSVEFHWNDDGTIGAQEDDGDVTYYESTDGGSTWSKITPNRTEYGTFDDGSNGDYWHHVEDTYASFSSGADRVKLVLSGADHEWTPQVGEVKIRYE